MALSLLFLDFFSPVQSIRDATQNLKEVKMANQNTTQHTSRKFSIPYMLRDLVAQLTGIFDRSLGLPMNVELPPATDEESLGTARLYFPDSGDHFTVRMTTYRNGFGQVVRINRIHCKLGFKSREEAEAWMSELQRFSGPLEWICKENVFSECKAQFRVEEMNLGRLEMAASDRRNQLPVYEYADPAHPLRKWAADRGKSY